MTTFSFSVTSASVLLLLFLATMFMPPCQGFIIKDPYLMCDFGFKDHPNTIPEFDIIKTGDNVYGSELQARDGTPLVTGNVNFAAILIPQNPALEMLRGKMAFDVISSFYSSNQFYINRNLLATRTFQTDDAFEKVKGKLVMLPITEMELPGGKNLHLEDSDDGGYSLFRRCIMFRVRP